MCDVYFENNLDLTLQCKVHIAHFVVARCPGTCRRLLYPHFDTISRGLGNIIILLDKPDKKKEKKKQQTMVALVVFVLLVCIVATLLCAGTPCCQNTQPMDAVAALSYRLTAVRRFDGAGDCSTTTDQRPRLIPRVIHQTDEMPFEQLPAEYKRNLQDIAHRNPTYEHRYYDAQGRVAFIRSKYDEAMVQTYLSIDPAYGPARADLFRYLLVYEEGGVYFDMKSGPKAPLDEVIRDTDEYLLSNWCEGECGRANWDTILQTGFGEFQQWWLVARPKHPFLRAVIDRCVANIHAYIHDKGDNRTFGKLGVLTLTGPIAYTQSINPIVTHHVHRFESHSFGGAFEYCRIDVDHTKIYKHHYSTLHIPIVCVGRLVDDDS
jgi:mannosyltransferase OCH1-like enzyme